MEEKKETEQLTPELIRQLIKGAVSKLGPNFTKEQKIAHAKMLVKVFEQGLVPQEAMKISDLEISEMYSFAYQLFNAGQFPQALELFKMLLVLETLEKPDLPQRLAHATTACMTMKMRYAAICSGVPIHPATLSLSFMPMTAT